jgi:PIN domain nuclease of toxin-antitoxin system
VTLKLLLDTNALLWAVRQPEKLTGPARNALLDIDNQLVVPASCAWELATKHRLGKLPEAQPVISDYDNVLARLRAASLPITHSHMLLAGSLDWVHRDPFDRLVAAVALLENFWIVSGDAVFDTYPGLKRLG